MKDKPFSPACERNREPILTVIRPLFEADGVERVLEIGSGTGQHAVYFAAALPQLSWVTSDRAANHAGIRAWIAEARRDNIAGPLTLDTLDFPGDLGRVDAVFSANTAHIMTWAAVVGMFAGVGEVLRTDGAFLLYGPFNRGGEYTSEGNRAFDASLRAEDPQMGIRDLEALQSLAAEHCLHLAMAHAMPANNLLLEWRRHVEADRRGGPDTPVSPSR